LLRAAGYGVGAMLAGVALVAGSYVAQPENPLWEFILRYPGNPLALSAGVWFACMPLAVALAAVLLARVERAIGPGPGGWVESGNRGVSVPHSTPAKARQQHRRLKVLLVVSARLTRRPWCKAGPISPNGANRYQAIPLREAGAACREPVTRLAEVALSYYES